MAEFHVGTSGWVYPHWRRRFYPEDLPSSRWLEYYAEQFDTAEVNYSFYKLPSAETFKSWTKPVPRNFLFAVKASRFLTHNKKLKDPLDPWLLMLGRALELGNHLGPILLQFPDRWKKNEQRLEEFLAMVADNSPSQKKRLKLAFEFRHESWFDDDIFNVLMKYNAALCIADSSKHRRHDVITADFVYFRYHGRGRSLAPDYNSRTLQHEAEHMYECLQDDIDVFAYFNNDGGAKAIKNAITLRDYINDYSGRRAA